MTPATLAGFGDHLPTKAASSVRFDIPSTASARDTCFFTAFADTFSIPPIS
jgi:hypothetical protein